MDIIAQITSEFHLQAWQVENVVKLIDEGNTCLLYTSFVIYDQNS